MVVVISIPLIHYDVFAQQVIDNEILSNNNNNNKEDDNNQENSNVNEFAPKPQVHVSIEGTENPDKIRGGDGNDVISGEEGDDILQGNEGDDKIDGRKEKKFGRK